MINNANGTKKKCITFRLFQIDRVEADCELIAQLHLSAIKHDKFNYIIEMIGKTYSVTDRNFV